MRATIRRRARRAPIGFPAPGDSRRLYDGADFNRAVQAYRFFYPTVSGKAIFRGSAEAGLVDNRVFGVLDIKPWHVGFTFNSDTPYGSIQLDLRDGPFILEMPPGPLLAVAVDVHQRWVADMGIPGPDAGRGGKHLMVSPGYEGNQSGEYHVWRSSSNHVLVGVRSIPVDGDVPGALDRIRTIKAHPLTPPAGWSEPKWIDLTETALDTTPLRWESNIGYWETLNSVIQTEPAVAEYRVYYGELAALGIAKGRPFAPDDRMKTILTSAAKVGLAQMRAQSFADRRPDCIVWSDRRWEWMGLIEESADFNALTYVDLDAREVWFYQAIGASPAMFRRKPGETSLHWIGLRDRDDEYLDGSNRYRLTVPLPVPAKLFWSVTVYDAETRSQIRTDQGNAALRSTIELKDVSSGSTIDLYFGPTAPAGHEAQWIKTIPRRGWFAYFRLYGPQSPAFDGRWKPGDFERSAEA